MKHKKYGKITVDTRPKLHLVEINAPGFFKSPKMVKFLEQPGVATWHVKGESPGEYSDVFFTLDGTCEGSNSPVGVKHPATIPAGIWRIISDLVRKEIPPGAGACLIRLTNLAE